MIYIECNDKFTDLLNKASHELCVVCKLELECSVYLEFVSSKKIKQINFEHRSNDSVTDVLSFPSMEIGKDVLAISQHEECIDENGRYYLGDVIICKQKIASQARENGFSYERELTYLFIHSLLHLLGYDHIDEQEKKQMREKEKAVVAAVFD